MGFITEERLSDSPLVEAVMHGRTEGEGFTIRPAEIHWHMVLVRHHGVVDFRVVGPLTSSGMVSFTEGIELLWIKFKTGTFMPRLPVKHYLNAELSLPEATKHSFWLDGSAWQFPNFENADAFIDRLARNDVLACDPVVKAALEGERQEVAERTVRHRFLRATGMTQSRFHQFERAQRAAALLQQGMPILDTVFESGYFDQPHLTRSLKQWIGHTPAQILRISKASNT